MTLQDWKKTGQSFLYQGQYQIFYQQQGQGPALTLLHGFPTAAWDWHKLWPQLTEQFQVIAPDFMGFGFSAKPRGYNYSIIDQATMVEQLLAAKGIQRTHILAHDYGDTVLQELLARVLDRQANDQVGLEIESVVLLNGGLFPESHQPRLIQKALLSPLGFLLTPFLNRTLLRRNFRAIFGPDTLPTEKEVDEFYALMNHGQGKYVFHLLIRYMAERKRFRTRWTKALQLAQIPIRLIDGTYDPISGRQMAERYMELIPDADVVLLEQIGHYPQTEAPALVLEHFEAFHQKNKKK